MKKILKSLIKVYLLPILRVDRLYYYVLDVFFSPGNLHIHRSLNFIKEQEKNPKGTIIDVGCHESGFIKIYNKKFPQSDVIAYEPNKVRYDIARNSYSSNPKIQIRNYALGRRNETGTLYVTKHDYSSSLLPVDEQKSSDLFRVESEQKCEIRTLDFELSDIKEILLMKLDVQGYELEVLYGGRETLKKVKYILLEMANHDIYHSAPKYFELDEFLRKNQFKLKQIYSPLGHANEYDALYKNSF